MSAWLVILLVMVLVILSINPTAEDYAWFRRLRRPAWMAWYVWLPQLWLLIYAGLYAAAVRLWDASGRLDLVVAILLLVVLVEGCTWFQCRTRRLGAAAQFGLGLWGYALVLSLLIWSLSPAAVVLLLPFLLWMPFESLGIWQLRRINKLP